MGKANKVKGEFLDVKESVELIQVLKDVADMRFHALAAERGGFARFRESFAEFFRLVGFSKVRHPLVANDNQALGIVALTTEEGFVGDLNNKVVARVLKEKEKNPEAQVILVGRKALGKLEMNGIKPAMTYEDIAEHGTYDLSIQIKDYLVDQVMSGGLGRVVVIYPWPKDMSILKARLVKLLPCEYILQQQEQVLGDFSTIIEESDPIDMTGYLANMWLSSVLMELFDDMALAAASAQSQQLETSLDKMKKESDVVRLKYRKAKKADIDASLREVFSARMMTTK